MEKYWTLSFQCFYSDLEKGNGIFLVVLDTHSSKRQFLQTIVFSTLKFEKSKMFYVSDTEIECTLTYSNDNLKHLCEI